MTLVQYRLAKDNNNDNYFPHQFFVCLFLGGEQPWSRFTFRCMHPKIKTERFCAVNCEEHIGI